MNGFESARPTTTLEDRRTPWVWVGVLTAIAIGLRVAGLNGGLWFDEIATLTDSVRLPLSTIVTQFHSNNQHTLFSVLAHASITTFGEHPWSLRLPAVVFGVATVPVLYLFAREFAGRVEALLACLLMATAYHPVWFSQNARGYSALAFLTVTASWLLLRALRRGGTIDAVWYGIAAALGVYAHLTMVFLVVSHAMLCVTAAAFPAFDPSIQRRWRAAALAFVLAGAFTLALYSPLLLDVKHFFVDQAKPATVATPGWAALELIKGLRIGLGAAVGAAAAGLLLVAGVWSYLRQSPFVAGLFLLPGVVTVVATVGLGRPIFPRFIYFLIGFGLLILVRGAMTVARWMTATRAPAAGAVIVAAMALASVPPLLSNYRYPKQDFDGAMRFIDERRPAAEPVVTVGLSSEVYQEYYRRDWPAVKSREELQALRAAGHRVWLVYTLEDYIESYAPDLMALIRTDCTPSAVFRGTVGGGDITVCTASPLNRRTP